MEPWTDERREKQLKAAEAWLKANNFANFWETDDYQFFIAPYDVSQPGISVDLSATDPAHFAFAVMAQAYSQGVEHGRADVRDKIKSALGIDQ